MNDIARFVEDFDDETANSFSGFDVWFARILQETKPSLLVSIARGAVRFLQLNAHGQISEGIKLLSHDGLCFVPESELRGKRVLVFDDSIIYGSTMGRVKEYLEARGALVFCVAHAVDRVTFLVLLRQ